LLTLGKQQTANAIKRGANLPSLT